MAKSSFPWRDGRSLRQVLAESRRWLERKRIIQKGGGLQESVLAAAEKRLGQPLPGVVRQFLLEVQPIPMFRDGELNEDGPDEFYFYRPEHSEFRWHALCGWMPQSDWSEAQGLAIGQTGYGDALYWVKGHRIHPDGCIAVDDHEVAMGDLQCAVLARSLSEFIAKVVHLKGLDPGALDYDLDNFAGDEEDEGTDGGDEEDVFGLAGQKLFDEEYAELNATSKKGGGSGK